ncbi:hypothetical protein GCM10008013_43630 [Paenibacillus segetis]|uniref:HTH gntR-type domain-containing protein n=2 Tax=Paenibacillus segetis TaxID=1325360 RepID=A0ABQ1YU32_9BACL|nr:hypothetical protein GCM10008013_43630 [Paenibacillus segetis]
MSSLSLEEIAYQEIRRKILDVEHMPNDLLSEQDLAEQFGMSRTPIRSALAHLETEGLVVTLKKRGVLIKEIQLQEVFDMNDMISAMQFYAIDIAEENEYPYDFELLEQYEQRVKEAAKNNDSKDYYENALLFMRTIILTLGNQSMIQIFDSFKDKLLVFHLVQRKLHHVNRPYMAIPYIETVLKSLKDKNIPQAKSALKMLVMIEERRR